MAAASGLKSGAPVAAVDPKGQPPAYERELFVEGHAPYGLKLRAKYNDVGAVLGAVVEDVVPGSPAQHAGFLKNDFIARVNGINVLNTPLDRVVEILKTCKGKVAIAVQGDTWFAMQAGQRLLKVREKLCPRKFFLTADFRKLRWESRRKEPRDAFLYTQEIKRVIKGRSGASFAKSHETAAPKVKAQMPEDLCFTVIYSERYNELNLVAPTKELRDIWVAGLEAFCKDQSSALQLAFHQASSVDQTVVDLFDYGSNQGKTMTELQCRELLHFLNCSITPKDLKDRFSAACLADGKRLNQKEFTFFFRSLGARKDLEEIVDRFGVKDLDNNTSFFDAPRLLKFLTQEQKVQGLTLDACTRLIHAMEPELTMRTQTHLGLEGFTRLMLGPDGSAWNQTHLNTVYQDLTQPLSHYFVSSSHNTYLTDHQLYGTSDPAQYRRAFLMGCKCVELDCWDGDDGEPIVYHGHTLTSKILFRDIIEVVRDYGFAISDMPVILSLEVHTCIEQQQKMAAYMNAILGDLLKVPYDPTRPHIPSPASMRGKVLIKGKKLPPEAAHEGEGEVSDEDEAADMVKDEKVMAEQTQGMQKKLLKRRGTETGVVKKHKIKLAGELSDLVTWVRGVHFKEFLPNPEAYATAPCDNIVSFSEGAAAGHMGNPETSALFVARNKKQLTRLYPAGFRVNSSNYDPMDFWIGGAQLVALNFQTPSPEMSLYRGVFRNNMDCGYLLKPVFLRDLAFKFDPNDPSTFKGITPRLLKVAVLGANNLPKPKGEKSGEVIDPYIMVRVTGVPKDRKEERTPAVENNGFNPRWNSEFLFPLAVPELAVLEVMVFDHDEMSRDDFIGSCVVPVPSLLEGYRHFDLRYQDDSPIRHATVFTKITLSDM